MPTSSKEKKEDKPSQMQWNKIKLSKKSLKRNNKKPKRRKKHLLCTFLQSLRSKRVRQGEILWAICSARRKKRSLQLLLSPIRQNQKRPHLKSSLKAARWNLKSRKPLRRLPKLKALKKQFLSLNTSASTRLTTPNWSWHLSKCRPSICLSTMRRTTTPTTKPNSWQIKTK